ncbi:MAG: FtsQ-type POTRA domain-containing protein [Clostridia bacterium]|nr:FtsQ-type POTRA domain-containing protein [Clostridia bacterium]MDH7573297.1 FtsQ-type POTRA domain-containing protein [Clostridia bacterium]
MRYWLLLAAVLALASWLFARSSFWELEAIKVRGNVTVSGEEIIRLSGLLPGENLLRLNKQAVKENLLRHPRIREVELRRDLPDTVLVEVRERVALVLIPAAGAFWEVDQEGRVLGARKAWSPADPLLLTGVTVPREQLVPGRILALPELGPLLAVAQALPPGIREEVQELHLANPGGICLYTREGVRVILGDAGEVEQKLALFWAIYREEQVRGSAARLAYIDVSRPKAPTLGYASGGE